MHGDWGNKFTRWPRKLRRVRCKACPSVLSKNFVVFVFIGVKITDLPFKFRCVSIFLGILKADILIDKKTSKLSIYQLSSITTRDKTRAAASSRPIKKKINVGQVFSWKFSSLDSARREERERERNLLPTFLIVSFTIYVLGMHECAHF